MPNSKVVSCICFLVLALSISNCRRRGGGVAAPAGDDRVGLNPQEQGNGDVLGAGVGNSGGEQAGDGDGGNGQTGQTGGDGQTGDGQDGGGQAGDGDGQDGGDGMNDDDGNQGDMDGEGDAVGGVESDKTQEEKETVGEGDAKVDVLDIMFDGQYLYKGSDSRMDKAITDAVDGSMTEAGLKYIYSVPIAVWIDGDKSDPTAVVEKVSKAAEEQDRRLVLVVHAVPKRHCTLGGAEVADAQEYSDWLDKFVQAVANRPALVILEPNALGKADDCAAMESTYSLQAMLDNIKMAVEKLTAVSTLDVYLEMGFWVETSRAAELVNIVDVDKKVKGLVINNSDYRANSEMNAFCENTNAEFNGDRTLPCIIDTGRNGVSSKEWCNTPEQGLGMLPADVSTGLLKGYLWVRNPADSDGECGRSEPDPGQIFPERAAELYEKRYKE